MVMTLVRLTFPVLSSGAHPSSALAWCRGVLLPWAEPWSCLTYPELYCYPSLGATPSGRSFLERAYAAGPGLDLPSNSHSPHVGTLARGATYPRTHWAL